MAKSSKVGKGSKNGSGENQYKKGCSHPSPTKGKRPSGKCP